MEESNEFINLSNIALSIKLKELNKQLLLERNGYRILLDKVRKYCKKELEITLEFDDKLYKLKLSGKKEIAQSILDLIGEEKNDR